MGEGVSRGGDLFAPDGHAAPFGAEAAAIASSGLWGEPAGLGVWGARICGFGSQKYLVSGARGPTRRPLPLRQVFVQRPLCVCVGGGLGAGFLAWRFPSIVTEQ